MPPGQTARADLEGASADEDTIWPKGFDPEAAGVRSAVIQTPLCLFGLSFRQEPGRATLLGG